MPRDLFDRLLKILNNRYYYYYYRFDSGRPAANTKLGGKRIHTVRTRGGNTKYRALRLESGNFSWASEGQARKTRVLTVVYNASNNELVRTNTLVKGAIIQVDATPFRSWYEGFYGLPLGKKKLTEAKAEEFNAAVDAKSEQRKKKWEERKSNAAIDQLLDDQFAAGRLYGKYFFLFGGWLLLCHTKVNGLCCH